jgi:hypothetical protein
MGHAPEIEHEDEQEHEHDLSEGTAHHPAEMKFTTETHRSEQAKTTDSN